MASIDKQANGRWRARYRSPEGKSRSRTFKLKGEAEKFLVSIEHSKEAGQFVDLRLGRTTVASWADTWMKAIGPTLKPKTVASYESLLRSRVLPTFGRRQLATIRPSDIQAWVSAMRAEGLCEPCPTSRGRTKTATRGRHAGRNAR